MNLSPCPSSSRRISDVATFKMFHSYIIINSISSSGWLHLVPKSTYVHKTVCFFSPRKLSVNALVVKITLPFNRKKMKLLYIGCCILFILKTEQIAMTGLGTISLWNPELRFNEGFEQFKNYKAISKHGGFVFQSLVY